MVLTGSRGIALVVVLSSLPIVTRAYTTIGQLVYNFTYSVSQSVSVRDDVNNVEPWMVGESGSSGISHYGGTLTDKGTITVHILQKQPDGAMVVTIGEQGENVRRAPPAECIVYGNTHVVCDPNKTVYTEEYTLLRFLGANFVDPSQVDASKHWSIVQNSGETDVHADYSINGNINGMMQIGEKRTVKDLGVGHLTTNIESTIGYDFSRSLPTEVEEYATQQTDAGIKGTSTTTYQTTLSLVTDTIGKP
jgi:hypothetical protein